MAQAAGEESRQNPSGAYSLAEGLRVTSLKLAALMVRMRSEMAKLAK
jgi:hypothetical protein